MIETAYDKKSKRNYISIKKICESIGMTKGMMQNERKRVQKDVLLKEGVKLIGVQTKGGIQKALHLEAKYLPIWLSSINRKSLSERQFDRLLKILSWSLSDNLSIYKIPSEKYEWESHMRDEIEILGYFDSYRIIGKEVDTGEGYVDLLAKDESDEYMGIELKKDKNFNNVIQQCKRYKSGLEERFGRRVEIAVCTLDDNKKFLSLAKKNGISVYKYERKLQLIKVL